MKKSKISEKARLQHIVEAIDLIEQFTQDVSYEEYLSDLKLQAALERKIEIIGEAANNISHKITESYPDIEWNKLKAFRNIIVHEYFGVSQKIIWDSVKYSIPQLKKVIEKLLADY